MKDNELQQELDLFRDTLVRFMDNEIAPHYEQWEKDKLIPKEFWLKMGAEGLLCCDIPEEYGGYGVPVHFNMLVGEELAKAGYYALATNVTVHADIVAHYLLNFGTEEQKQKYLPAMVSGECIGAICMTEPSCGSDLQGMKTTAIANESGWLMNGSKTFITNGQNASLYIVAARTDLQAKPAKGTSLFLVEGDQAGFQRGTNLDKIGQAAGDTSELFFDNVELGKDQLLGQLNYGFIGLMKELPRERLALACGAVAHAEGAMALAVDYVKERQAFGAPLSNLQTIRHKLAEMATQIEIHRVLIEEYKDRLFDKALSTEQASIAKLSCTEMECKVIDDALQLFGGYGYMKEYPIARFYVDARVQRIYGGTSEIMKEIVGRSLVRD
ncbi:acyl-CoA dehydrogenase family protein [Paraferrimonas sedimenticola]|uniref:Acyl-CoA dehydrogenase n=1 Tax=Paraferrimonas sedimenticola TaxID=375674 RepID=A0AA37VSZ7_9GAMM|nr:acyl-CoA dehydrogenase family protein [Paraferrimonas sedimenticola]GLP95049.1 acyl-CoA dehydrogenase [Paraferrimonas sedimenticola]